MVGIEGRACLLFNLSKALQSSQQFFGVNARPGNIIGNRFPQTPVQKPNIHIFLPDFLESESKAQDSTRIVPVAALWHALIEGLNPIWPSSRTSLGGISLGDVWPCSALKASSPSEGDDLIPFHKLTGWTTYSLMEPIERILKWKFEGLEDMTGLPEYRNGESCISTCQQAILTVESYFRRPPA